MTGRMPIPRLLSTPTLSRLVEIRQLWMERARGVTPQRALLGRADSIQIGNNHRTPTLATIKGQNMKRSTRLFRIGLWGMVAFFAQSHLLTQAHVLAQENERVTVEILTRGGKVIDGTAENLTIEFGQEKNQSVKLHDVLSIHSASPASEYESKLIEADLGRLGNVVEPAAEVAAAQLADIGLPVMTPLLQSYTDTDAKQPDYRYRLFGRIIPGHADSKDRTLDLIRLANGTTTRGKLLNQQIVLRDKNGNESTLLADDIRRIAVLRDKIERTFELQALHDCTYVGFMDAGIVTTSASTLAADAEGYIRLSFDEDGWSTDPNGIATPLPGKRKLQEGFRWGSLLGRVGPEGDRWYIGKHIEKSDIGSGRLYFVINDNEHWQNNIGSFRVHATVTNAFDVGEPY